MISKLTQHAAALCAIGLRASRASVCHLGFRSRYRFGCFR